MRQIALKDLERALEYDPQHGEALLLIARLQWLPGGDRERGREAADAAVRLLPEDDQLLSRALVQRARYAEDDAQRIKDYAEAIRLDARNEDAWRERGLYYLGKRDRGRKQSGENQAGKSER